MYIGGTVDAELKHTIYTLPFSINQGKFLGFCVLAMV